MLTPKVLDVLVKSGKISFAIRAELPLHLLEMLTDLLLVRRDDVTPIVFTMLILSEAGGLCNARTVEFAHLVRLPLRGRGAA